LSGGYLENILHIVHNLTSQFCEKKIQMFPSKFAFVILLGLSSWSASAFLGAHRGHASTPQVAVASPSAAAPSIYPSSTRLRVVADYPTEKEEQKKGKSEDAWIPSNGGFIPNIKSRLITTSVSTTSPSVLQVTDIQQYKDEVVDVLDQMVCVRFYAPWCRACRAIEAPFRRLNKDFPNVKFVEVPLTKENAYLHKGLGVPSLPFAHLYDPSVGLVEERSLNKKVFGAFKTSLKAYAEGLCEVTYDEDGSRNYQ
jgi:thiol-disulfide isomerase/thioredoxin